MNDDEWKEMDAKATSAIRLNLSNEVIHNVTICVLKKLELGTQPLVSALSTTNGRVAGSYVGVD
jgi:hypothetical protein